MYRQVFHFSVPLLQFGNGHSHGHSEQRKLQRKVWQRVRGRAVSCARTRCWSTRHLAKGRGGGAHVTHFMPPAQRLASTPVGAASAMTCAHFPRLSLAAHKFRIRQYQNPRAHFCVCFRTRIFVKVTVWTPYKGPPATQGNAHFHPSTKLQRVIIGDKFRQRPYRAN